MKLLTKLSAAGALCLFAHAASAVPTTWVDHINFNPDIHLTTWTSYSYTHDINDNGFNAGTDGVYSYSLSLNLYDDSDPYYDPWEIALLDLPGFAGDRLFFDLSGTENGGWSLAGNAQLEGTGQLSITIASLWGDFFIGDSTLTVDGEAGRTSVPEPGTLGVMGLGLLGLASLARRKTKA